MIFYFLHKFLKIKNQNTLYQFRNLFVFYYVKTLPLKEIILFKSIYLKLKINLFLMKLLYSRISLLFLFLFSLKGISQETLPIYQDYLSDNVYLVHPSAAGIGNSSKLRFTARQQWAGIPNAPALQTLSFHSKFGEYSNAGYGYYNADFSMAYHLGGFSSYFTVKNLLLTAKNNLNVQEPLDLRNYIFSAGYYFGQDLPIQFEPSLMLQFREGTGQRIADFNIKAYKNLSKSQLWAALSYRRGFDANAIENAQFISPIIGLNYQNLLFSYTYTNQMNETVLTTTGFHQVTVGINLWTREPRAAACPNINAAFGGF